jgi:hypothetical protein
MYMTFAFMQVAMHELHRLDGFKGFFRGAGALMFREVPFYVFGMVLYEQYKRCFNGAYFGSATRELSNREYIALGALAGASASLVTTPADVIKSRMMTTPAGTQARTAQVIVDIIQKEGMLALFKGALPRAVWIAPLGAMNFAGYELAKKAMGVISDAAADSEASGRAGGSAREAGNAGASAAGGVDAAAHGSGSSADAVETTAASAKQIQRPDWLHGWVSAAGAQDLQGNAPVAASVSAAVAIARKSIENRASEPQKGVISVMSSDWSCRTGGSPSGGIPGSASVPKHQNMLPAAPPVAGRLGASCTERALTRAQRQEHAAAVARARSCVSGNGTCVQVGDLTACMRVAAICNSRVRVLRAGGV